MCPASPLLFVWGCIISERIAYLEAIVGADITQFRRGMADIRNEVGILSETMSGIAGLGRTLTYTFTTPVVALGGFAVQAASDFEAAMRNVNSIAQLSEDQFQDLSAAVLDFGSTTRSGVVESANALYTTFSAGITDTAAAMEFMEVASRTAEAGLADITTTTEALVASFLAYSGQELPLADQLEMITLHADALTQMVQIGVGDMNTFATAVGRVIPSAVALDVSIQDLYASMAFLTQRGLTAYNASTSLNATLVALNRPTTAMTAAFRELGVTTGQELIDAFGGLEPALQALISTADGSAEALTAIFQNKQALRAVQLMMENMDAYEQAVLDFGAGLDGATDRAWEQQMMSFAAQWDLLTAAAEGAAITIGSVLIPVLLPLVEGLTDGILALQEVNPQLLQLGVAVVGVAAAMAPMLWLFGSLVTPIGMVTGAIAGLAVAFETNLGGIADTLNDALSTILGDTTELGSIAQELLDILFPPDFDTEVAEGVAEHTVAVPAEDLITIEAGDTLWDIWFANYQDQFTWDAFKAAVGWGETLHMLQPGDVLRIPNSFGADVTATFRDAFPPPEQLFSGIWDGFDRAEDFQGYNPDEMPAPNMGAAPAGDLVSTLTERLFPAFQQVIDRAREWFDDKVGAGIAWIASLFDNAGGQGGDTPVYNAVSSLLEGDVEAAINAVIPGLGTTVTDAVGGWADNIGDAFPRITEAMGTLLTNVGTWLVDEGIPTVARFIGNFGGRLAVVLYDTIAGVFDFFGSGMAGDVAGGVGEYVGGTLLPEVQEGWNDALEGSRLHTEGFPALQGALDGIGGIFDTLNIDDTTQGLGRLAEGMVDFATDLAGADWSGVQRLIAIGATLGGALLALTNSVTSEVLETLGGALSVVGDVLAGLVTALSGLVSFDAGTILRGLGEGLRGLATGVLLIPAGIIDTVIKLLETIDGYEYNLPDMTDLVQQWAADMEAEAQAALVFDGAFSIDPSGMHFEIPDQATLDAVLSQVSPELGAALLAYFEANPLTADGASITVTPSGDATVNFDPLTAVSTILPQPVDAEATAGTLTFIVTDNTTTALDTTVTLPPVEGGSATVELTDITLTTATGATVITGELPDIPAEILPAGEMETHMTEEAAAGAEAISTTLMNTFLAGGVNDPAILENNFLIPMKNAFVEYLGVESETVTTVTNFAATVGEQLDIVGTELLELDSAVVTHSSNVYMTLLRNTPLITQQLFTIQGSVDSLTAAFNAMAAAAQAAANIQLPAAPPAAAPPRGGTGHRAEGGDVNAGQSYFVGERGMELFVPGVSGVVIPNDVLFGGSRGGGGDTIIQQTVNIHEVSNLDQILYEAKRRGVRLQ